MSFFNSLLNEYNIQDNLCKTSMILAASLFAVSVILIMCQPTAASAESSHNSTGNNKKPKTVYLIRHAETQENVRMNAFHDIGRALQKGRLPSANSMKLGTEFVGMTLGGKHDSKLSKRGKQQVLQLQSILRDNQLYDELDLIVHSPLRRAKETCYGIFHLTADMRPQDLPDTGDDTVPFDKKIPPVEELASLTEVTQWELKTQGQRPVRKRIQAFHEWLDGLEESVETIAIVGHSEYFMIMLALNRKFMNCDVWKATYGGNGTWTDLNNEVRLDMFSSRSLMEDDNENKPVPVNCCVLASS
jgi:broad specificity phosphatase PhoE